MLRRNFLILSSSTCVCLAGCSASPDNTRTPSAMTDEPEDFDEQYLEIRNRTENRENISLSIEGQNSVIMQGQYVVETGQTIYIPPQISEGGDYELTVSRSGGTEVSKTLGIGEYDFKQGINIIIKLRSRKIEIIELE